MAEVDVFATCCGCFVGAIYVPEVGPMGDEFCETIEEAVELDARTSRHWVSTVEGWLCPLCAESKEPAHAA